jgi:uncharacterized membrane protein YeiH
MSQTLLLIFEIIGTVSFAVSGAMTAIAKKMDILGVVILATVTAVGGGAIRDIVLGIHPPVTFSNPIYTIFAVLTAVVVFIPAAQRFLQRKNVFYEYALLIMDSLGLAVFTVIGIRTAIQYTSGFNVFLLLFVGVITGIGGGVLRDILAGNIPYIFIKHFYASASIIGAAVCIGVWKFIGGEWAMVIGSVVIFVLRILAARFRWTLPHPKEI